MATTVPPTQNPRASSRPAGSGRTGRGRHADHRRREMVSDTLAALRDGGLKRFARGNGPTDTARSMLDRLRSR